MKDIGIQVVITIFAIVVMTAHLVWPALTIDAVTVALVTIAMIPWLGSLFKSFELAGVLKVEYRDLEQAKEDADRAGLLAPTSSLDRTRQDSFQLIADNDPNLALAGLRIEIEKGLQNIAEKHNISRKQGVSSLMRALLQQGVLSQQEYGVLADMIGLLNSAVHGATVDNRALEWAMETGPRLLKSLENISVRNG